MHETDAMLFIESALLGFLSRQFGNKEGEDPSRYEPHLEKIQAFIHDKEPYWVKEKAFLIIDNIEYAETSIKAGQYTPTTPDIFITTVLDKVRKRLVENCDAYRLEKNPSKMTVFMDLPIGIKEK